DLYVFHFFADDLQRIYQRGENNNGGSVLVVMENRNIQFLDQTLLDLKTAWSGNIFEVDAAETDGNILDRSNDLIWVFRIYADRKSINAAEFLEKLAFSFHHRHRRRGADVAEPEHSGSVRNDCDRILFYRKVECFFRVF